MAHANLFAYYYLVDTNHNSRFQGLNLSIFSWHEQYPNTDRHQSLRNSNGSISTFRHTSFVNNSQIPRPIHGGGIGDGVTPTEIKIEGHTTQHNHSGWQRIYNNEDRNIKITLSGNYPSSEELPDFFYESGAYNNCQVTRD